MDKFKQLIAIAAFSTVAVMGNVSYAEDKMPTFDCTMSDQVSNDTAVGKKDTFIVTTPMVYLVCDSENVVKGQNIKVVWTAVDTHGDAPANYKIDETNLAVSENLHDNLVWTGTYSLSKPKNGWPIGSYRADLMVNDHLFKSFDFTVKAQ
jgi:hypothetical protein